MRKLILYIGLLAFSMPGYSQDSLMHYLELATKNNPTVLQRYNEYQASLQKVPQVGSLPDPQLEMGVFLITTNQFHRTQKNAHFQLRIGQTAYLRNFLQ